MKDEFMMARIRDAEHAQLVAELTQKVSLLELKVSYRRIMVHICTRHSNVRNYFIHFSIM